MGYAVSILSEAEMELDEAYIWYESKQIDLGNKFFKVINDSVKYISSNPYACSEIYTGTRRFIVKKFPYGIYYKVNFALKEIRIVGILHFIFRSG
jgi:hypothetical protein